LYSDAYFADPHAATGFLTALSGVLAFSFQILFDFSGYSDIAIGSAALLGFRFMENFRRPYLSFNVTDFWRRWHISLSTWLRDYLYIPLGGNRHGTARMYLNVMITMLLGGLWHGASWQFLIWGGLHGGYLVVHKQYSCTAIAQMWRNNVVYLLLSWWLTMSAVALAWVFFRATSLGDAVWILHNLSGMMGWGTFSLPWGLSASLIGVMVLMVLEERWQLQTRLLNAPFIVQGIALATVLMVLSVFAVTEQQIAFIYFQF